MEKKDKEILLNKFESDKPFVWKEGDKYFIDNVEYTDDINILLNAIKNVKTITYHEMFEKVDTKEEYWQLQFNYMYNNGSLVLWHNPSEGWDEELARRGEKLCPDCGKPMEMYYVPTCFHCKKPMPDKKGRGNLLEARNWLRNNESEFNADKWWHYLCDNDYIKGNDTWTSLPSDSNNEQMKLFLKHFPVNDILWEVSW
jgi:hypothetical protein